MTDSANNLGTESEKSVSRSVSMPFSLWEACDSFADQNHGGRSPYITGLVRKDLEKAGALPDDPKARELTRIAELIDAGGLEEVRRAVDEITKRQLAAA